MNITLDNTTISKHLGQVSQYKSTYDPELLVAEPRANNRKHLDIDDNNLPFVGFDTWNAYEVSGLQNNGKPVAAIAKIQYSCTSPSIVESKSIKLYFNSYNMEKLGNNSQEVCSNISQRAAKDLSDLLETEVKVHLIEANDANQSTGEVMINSTMDCLPVVWNNIDHLDDQIDQFDIYQETPALLLNNVVKEEQDYEYGFHSALLKSNCRVTSQPDWGDVYIYMSGKAGVRPHEKDLLKYIISFRDECHFHEEICETIYIRLKKHFNFEQLAVTCLYARRGGIDINPSRASSKDLLPSQLADVTALHMKTPKQ